MKTTHGKSALKKKLWIWMSVLLISTPGISYAAPVAESDFETSDNSDGTITISKYTGTEKDVTIPEKIGGKTVTEIGEKAFENLPLTNVEIPNSVTRIEDFAFVNNQLTSVKIPNSVTTIGFNTFAFNKLASVEIPNSVTEIRYGAFQGNQLTSVEISNSVTEIEQVAFAGNQLTSVTIPNSVTTIGLSAFVNNKLTSVTIGTSVTVIKDSAFKNNQLISVDIPNGVTTLGTSAFADNQLMSVEISNGVIVIGDSVFTNNQLVSVEIPNSVTTIGSSAFANNKLTSATIGTSVTLIKDSAFKDNELTSVEIPNSVTVIEPWVFANNELTSVEIPSSVKTIETSMFINNKLTSVKIPNGVIGIMDNAFANNQLTSVEISNSVTSIGAATFVNNQLTSVEIPNSVTTIGGIAFGNNQLTSVEIPNSVTEIEKSAFEHNQLTSVEIPNSLKMIGNFVFANNQLASVEIPNSVTAIGDGAFEHNQLTSVEIPNSVTEIRASAFANNELTSVEIPDSVTTIGDKAFTKNHLNKVTFKSSIHVISSDSFFNQTHSSKLFVEWFTDEDFTTYWSSTVPKAMVIYAKYSEPKTTYTVTYDGNGNTGGIVPVSSSYEEGATVTAAGNTGSLVKTGHSFNGWNTTADGSGDSYTPGTTFSMGKSNLTLYAQWTANPTYTVTYDGNGNTGGSVPVSSSYEEGATVPVVGNTGSLVKAGYTFNGWNTTAAGSGDSYTPGTTFPMGKANLTLYAQWTTKPTTYTVTYDGNGNTGGIVPVSISYEEGATVTAADNTGSLVKTGHSFNGWNTTAAGTGIPYSAGDTFPMGTANLTLYAQWTTNPIYTVTYDGNGNTGGIVPVSISYEEGATVTAAGNTGTLVKTGHSFNGWNTKADGTGTPYSEGATFPMGTANLTLYAQWTTNPIYTVTYDGNGNTGGSVPVSSSYEEGATVPVVGNTGSLVKEGHTFNGWNMKADGTGTPHSAGSTFSMGKANLTLYAQWTTNPTYTITYDGNGSTGGSVPVSSSYEEGATVIAAGNTGNLMKAGHSFNGWNLKADGTGTPYSAGSTFSMGTANLTLYAQWTTNPTYTVTYDGNGSTGGSVPVSSSYEEGATVPVVGNTGSLVKAGHTFNGWNMKADGTGTPYSVGATFPMGTANLTLYAQWTTNPIYTVTYDGNGNTGGSVPVSSSYEEGDPVTAAGNTGSLVKAGRTFNGWNMKADGTGTPYSVGATFPMGTANLTLYAQWTTNPIYTVTYDGNGNTGGSVPVSSSYEEGDPVTAAGNTGSLVKVGHTFSGWNSKADGTGTPYSAGATFPIGKANLTLYAKWSAVPITPPIDPGPVKPPTSPGPGPVEPPTSPGPDPVEPPASPGPVDPTIPLPSSKFKDVSSNWAQEMIEYIASRGIITGYPDGTFRPNEPITRQHVALMLTRALKLESNKDGTGFMDVSRNHPYYEAIKQVQQAGIFEGNNGNFNPNANMTRAQMAKVIVLAFVLTSTDTQTFKDVPSTHWAHNYIAILAANGIALGDNGDFKPEEPVTRAQFAAFLYRVLNK